MVGNDPVSDGSDASGSDQADRGPDAQSNDARTDGATAGRGPESTDPADPFRPVYHFAPRRGWMNDPNGLVHHDGQYHLFYQAGEATRRWDHATSDDLVHWTEQGTKLPASEGLQQFSGGAVVDERDTAGFGANALVFTYTGHRDGEFEDQRLAYSTDGARTVREFERNPIIPSEHDDFRDPNVFWYDPDESWRMVVSRVEPAPDRPAGIEIYSSEDLLAWTYESTYELSGTMDDGWECPDLYEVPIEPADAGTGARAAADRSGGSDDGRSTWVLTVSVNWERQEHHVGHFDGTEFRPERRVVADHGFDFYAGMTWANEPRNRRLLLGWLSHWDYAQDLPNPGWRGIQSFPREVTLVETDDGPELRQRPASELSSIRDRRLIERRDERLAPGTDPLAEAGVEGRAFVVDARFDPGAAERVELGLRTAADQRTTVAYDAVHERLLVDRTDAGAFFDDDHYGIAAADLEPLADGTIDLQVLVDRCSIEVFANEGRLVSSNLCYPDWSSTGTSLEARGGTADLARLVVDEVRPDGA